MKSICIAIPSYRPQPSRRTSDALENSIAIARVKGWHVDVIPRIGDSCLPRARCVLFTQFVERTTATDLLFVDDDIGWTADGFVQLMEHDADIVGGVYPSRGPVERYIFRPLGEELRRVNGLFEVAAVGAGFLRITRAAAERMIAAYPDDWYVDETAPGLKIRDLFAFSVENHVLHSEDFNFCRWWRDIDGKVWADPDLDLDHDGNHGNLLGWLKRRRAMEKVA